LRYCRTVFNSFSFAVTSKQAVDDQQRSIAAKLAEFRNADFAAIQAQLPLSKKQIAWIVLRRTIGLSISLFILLGTPTAVYFIVQYYNEINGTFPYTTSLISSFITLILPKLLTWMVFVEGYAERSTTEWNIIIRTFIIKMTTTIALMVRVLFLPDSAKCKQTEAGLVFWQMLWIEFGVNVAKTSILMPLKFKILQGCAKSTKDEFEESRKGKLEFDVPENVIELLYRQSLIFVGLIMSPMIPLAGLITNLLLYFLKYLIMRWVCKFPDNPFERGRSSPFNLNMLLLTFTICLVPLGFFLFQSSGSVCGPFRANIIASSQMPVEAAVNALSLALAFYQNEQTAIEWESVLFYASHKITLGSVVVFLVIIIYFVSKFTTMFQMKFQAADKRADLERKEKGQILREYVQKTHLKY